MYLFVVNSILAHIFFDDKRKSRPGKPEQFFARYEISALLPNPNRGEDRIDGEDTEDNDDGDVLTILPRREVDLVRIRRERIAARKRCELRRSPHDEDVEEEEYTVDVEEVQIAEEELRDDVDNDVEGEADLCPHRRDALVEKAKQDDDDKWDVVEAHVLLQEVIQSRRRIDEERRKPNGDEGNDDVRDPAHAHNTPLRGILAEDPLVEVQ